MRKQAEIDAEIAHVEYSQSIFSERLTALKAERDLLREDKFAKAKLTKRLAEFFKVHGLYIVSLQTGERSKDHYDLAKQVWRSREVLIPFIKKMSANKVMPFTYNISGISLPQMNDLRNFCLNLTSKGWLTYTQCDSGFNIKPTLTDEQKVFVQGGWAEEVTLYGIDKTLKEFTKEHRLKYKLFWNTKLKRIDPDSKMNVDMELDLVAQVADRFYIFETKSGEVTSIGKWVDRTRIFDDKKNRFITCTADENLKPKIFKPFKLIPLPILEVQFTQMLEKDFTENPALPISATVSTPEKKV